MNLSLLQLVGKYITLCVVSVLSVFNIGNYNEKEAVINNNNIEKDVPVINTITDYDTVVQYNNKLPSNVENIVKEGVVGLSIEDTENTEEVIIQQVSNEVVEKGAGDYGIYAGKLVGYGPDCIGCSGEGYVACRTEDKSKFSLYYDGIYYEDDEYGKVRVVAAATKKFPCGTIVKITNGNKDPFMVVVLDTGGTVIKAWNNGAVIMDLAYTENALAGSDGLTGNNITFEVQRWGW